MRARLFLGASLVALAIQPVYAQMPVPIVFPPASSPPPAYAGVGDVQAMAMEWDFDAYSAATKGNGQAVICTAGDASCLTITSDATTGLFRLADAQAMGCTDNSCTVEVLCELVSNDCTTTGGHLSLLNGTEAARPTLHFPCGPVPVCARFTSASQYLAGDFPAIISQPWSEFVVINPETTSDFSWFQLSTTAGQGQIGSTGSSRLYVTTDGTTNSIVSSTITANTWQALAALLNGASSDLWYNSTHVGTGNAGTGGTTNNSAIVTSIGSTNTRDFAAMGYWAGGTNQTAVIANERTNKGF